MTNIRNLSSLHWRRWLGESNRCLVPLTSFSEPRGKGKGVQWFASANGGPIFLAGIETRGWTSLRKDGKTTDDLFGFLTSPPNAEVVTIHPKAMPVILATAQKWEAWPSGISAEELQRRLPDGALMLIEGPI